MFNSLRKRISTIFFPESTLETEEKEETLINLPQECIDCSLTQSCKHPQMNKTLQNKIDMVEDMSIKPYSRQILSKLPSFNIPVATGRNTSSIWPEKLDQIHKDSIVSKIIECIAEYSTEYRTVTTLIDKDPIAEMIQDKETMDTRPDLDFLDKMRKTQVIILPDMIFLDLDVDNVDQALKDVYLSKPSTGLFNMDSNSIDEALNGTALKGMILICAHKVFRIILPR
jgi:hypothetical protein